MGTQRSVIPNAAANPLASKPVTFHWLLLSLSPFTFTCNRSPYLPIFLCQFLSDASLLSRLGHDHEPLFFLIRLTTPVLPVSLWKDSSHPSSRMLSAFLSLKHPFHHVAPLIKKALQCFWMLSELLACSSRTSSSLTQPSCTISQIRSSSQSSWTSLTGSATHTTFVRDLTCVPTLLPCPGQALTSAHQATFKFLKVLA